MTPSVCQKSGAAVAIRDDVTFTGGSGVGERGGEPYPDLSKKEDSINYK